MALVPHTMISVFLFLGMYGLIYLTIFAIKRHHIGLAPKYLSDCVSTVSAASGKYRLRSTGSEAYIFCQEQEQDLVNVASSAPVQPPGTLFHPTFMILLIPVHFENDSRMYFLIVLLTDSAGAPGPVV